MIKLTFSFLIIALISGLVGLIETTETAIFVAWLLYAMGLGLSLIILTTHKEPLYLELELA
jgi:uncharacterized membrane protein YtjA (UPF0391 family)